MADSLIAQFLTQRQGWLEQLSSTEVLLKLFSLLDQSGLYVLNQNQTVIYWSNQASVLTGYSVTEVIDRPCLVGLEIASALATIEKQAITLPALHTGVSLKFLKSGLPLFTSQGEFAGAIGLLQVNAQGEQSVQKSSVHSSAAVQNFQGILSRSPAMQAVFQIIENAAETTATVLVRGESGAGKELVARAIHHLSARRQQPFLAINCAALSSNLLESELFGHVRGAFTGAVKDHQGLFQRAQGGTLFLDEVAELPLELQAKLLRVLQERNCLPVGGHKIIEVDVRIVAATHRSLREEVKAGRFREDLMYRLRVVPIFIPPLRERREDIGLLIWHFIREHNAENVRQIERIEPLAMRQLLDYPWPGNIRELHNVVEYAFAVGRGATLRLSELPPEFRELQQERRSPSVKTSTKVGVADEQQAVQQALRQSQGKVSEAAASLGMSRATFWRKRKLYGV